MAVLGVAAFWACNLMALHFYPTEFDWRYMPLTALLSPRDDPAGAMWARVATALCGLSVLMWAIGLARGWSRFVLAERPAGVAILGVGGATMACAALMPLKIPGLPFEHQAFSTLGYTGLSVGLARLIYQVACRAAESDPRASPQQRAMYGACSVGIIIIPIVVGLLLDAYVFRVYKNIHWLGLVWREQGVPAYMSFALWEWITLAMLSVAMVALAIAGDARAIREQREAAAGELVSAVD